MHLVVTVNHATDGSLEVGVVATFSILDKGREESRQLRGGRSQNIKDFTGLRVESRYDVRDRMKVRIESTSG